MKKLKRSYVNNNLILLFFLLFASFHSSEAQSETYDNIVPKLVEFKLFATNPKDCILFSPHTPAEPVTLHKRTNKKSKPVRTELQGTPCKIVKSTQTVRDELWFQIQISKGKEGEKGSSQKGWVPYNYVISAPSIRILREGKNVLLHLKAPCLEEPCESSLWFVSPTIQRHLDIGTERPFAIGRGGEYIFYDKILKERGVKDPSNHIWKSYIYRYDIELNQITKLGTGTSPVSHPSKNLLVFRNFRGQVMSSDYMLQNHQVIYTPEQPKELGKTIYLDPSIGVLPGPVVFVGADTIRFDVLYSQGKFKKEFEIPFEPEKRDANAKL